MAHGGRARGETGGEVHWFPLFGLPKNLTTGLIGRARGEMGGGIREQCGSNKSALAFAWIWLVTRVGGRRGEVAHGGRARGEMGSFFWVP